MKNKSDKNINDDRHKNGTEKKLKVIAFLKFFLLLLIIAAIPLYLFIFHKDIITSMSSWSDVRAYIDAYRGPSAMLIIFMQIIQIIICIIPGQWIQIGGSYIFGFWIGLFLSLVGAFCGTIITYYIAKILGRDFVHMIAGEEKTKIYTEKLNSKKAMLIVFLVYLIPGTPKDMCNYIAGISEMKLRPFLVLSMVGRTPAMMGSLLIGYQLSSSLYGAAIAVGAVAIILFILCIIFRDKIFDWFDKVYNKLMKL